MGAAAGVTTAGCVEAAACGSIGAAGDEGSIEAGVVGFWFGGVAGRGGETTGAGLDVGVGVGVGALA